MTAGKLGVLADILKTASSLCIRYTTVACNNNCHNNNNKSLESKVKTKR